MGAAADPQRPAENLHLGVWMDGFFEKIGNNWDVGQKAWESGGENAEKCESHGKAGKNFMQNIYCQPGENPL